MFLTGEVLFLASWLCVWSRVLEVGAELRVLEVGAELSSVMRPRLEDRHAGAEDFLRLLFMPVRTNVLDLILFSLVSVLGISRAKKDWETLSTMRFSQRNQRTTLKSSQFICKAHLKTTRLTKVLYNKKTIRT